MLFRQMGFNILQLFLKIPGSLPYFKRYLRRFFAPSGVGSASDQTLETDVLPPKME